MNFKPFYILLLTVFFNCKNKNNLPQIIDNPNLEKEKIVIFSEKDNDSLILSKNELNKIEKLFPILNSEFALNPEETYLSSGIWKEYLNKNGLKEKYTFGSEAGEDNFYLVYAYFLKQKNGDKKYKTERQTLIELYKSINGIYDMLNYGGTFYGHQYKRLNASAEYSIYLLNKNEDYYNKKHDFNSQKKLYLKSLIQYVKDEESQNVNYQIDLVENKGRAIEREIEFKNKIDILKKLITNYFYLNQVQEYENKYR